MKLKCKCCRGCRGTGPLVLHQLPPSLIEFGQHGRPGRVKTVPQRLSGCPKTPVLFVERDTARCRLEGLLAENLVVFATSKFTSLECVRSLACILRPRLAVQVAPGICGVAADRTGYSKPKLRDTAPFPVTFFPPSLAENN